MLFLFVWTCVNDLDRLIPSRWHELNVHTQRDAWLNNDLGGFHPVGTLMSLGVGMSVKHGMPRVYATGFLADRRQRFDDLHRFHTHRDDLAD